MLRFFLGKTPSQCGGEAKTEFSNKKHISVDVASDTPSYRAEDTSKMRTEMSSQAFFQ